MNPNPRTKRRAEAAAKIAARELGLDPVRIEWVPAADMLLGANGLPALGYTKHAKPDTIHIRAEHDPGSVVDTVAHEMRHLFHYKHDVYGRGQGDWRVVSEHDALSYGQQFEKNHALELKAEEERALKAELASVNRAVLQNLEELSAMFGGPKSAANAGGCGCGSCSTGKARATSVKIVHPASKGRVYTLAALKA